MCSETNHETVFWIFGCLTTDGTVISQKRLFFLSYLSWGFLQVETAEVGRVLAVLHGLSFTLPCGLFTPLEGRKQIFTVCLSHHKHIHITVVETYEPHCLHTWKFSVWHETFSFQQKRLIPICKQVQTFKPLRWRNLYGMFKKLHFTHATGCSSFKFLQEN